MNTTEPRLHRVEVAADLPVLWATMQRLDLAAAVDRHFPRPRHWKGPLSPGEVLAVWLVFILSAADHRLNQVEPWVAQHHGTLSALLGKTVLPVNFHDDRLADWLDRLSSGDSFSVLEQQLNQHTIRVYQLPTDTVRYDTTTANSYGDVLSEQGLLQFGHSKDDPDRPQLKIAAGVLDPLGMPLVTMVVPGNCSDDPLYIPAIAKVQQTIGQEGLTHVGDCKMAALATRGFVVAGRDFYLCPLSENQLSRAERGELLQPVFAGTQALERVWRPGGEGQPDELVAEGFSVDVEQTTVVDDKQVRWTERRWLVRSVAYAQAQQAALERRLDRASKALEQLVVRKQGKKQLYHAELMEAASAIVKREGVEGLLSYTAQAMTRTRQVRAYRGRPARQDTEIFFQSEVRREEALIEQKKREMGWQVYAANALTMGLAQVVWAYRGQYRIENDWSRLKGRPLGLTPMYLTDEQRMQGLVHLLSLALRLLTLLEWQVRERLRKEGTKLQGVYAGQAGRKTARPSAELLLGAMKTISVSVVEVNGGAHALLSPLTDVQRRLLDLWDLPPDLYDALVAAFPTSPTNTRDPSGPLALASS
jgi:transposase